MRRQAEMHADSRSLTFRPYASMMHGRISELAGLDYADQRYYASSYGRFNTADPYGGSARLGNPGSWNKYSYVQGDPVNQIDPSGLLAQAFCSAEYATCGPSYSRDPWWDDSGAD